MKQASFLGPQYEKEIQKPKPKESRIIPPEQLNNKIQKCFTTGEACVFARFPNCLKEDTLMSFIKKCDFNK